VRVWVARGNIEYSAVTHPSPLLRTQRGTLSSSEAEHTTRVSSYDEFKSVMEGRPGFVIAGWCGSADCEARIKADTQATLRNIPFGSRQGGSCILCGRPASAEAWFAKAY